MQIILTFKAPLCFIQKDTQLFKSIDETRGCLNDIEFTFLEPLSDHATAKPADALKGFINKRIRHKRFKKYGHIKYLVI